MGRVPHRMAELRMTLLARSGVEVWAPRPRIKCGAGERGASEREQKRGDWDGTANGVVEGAEG